MAGVSLARTLKREGPGEEVVESAASDESQQRRETRRASKQSRGISPFQANCHGGRLHPFEVPHAVVASLDPYGREPDAEANASCANGRQRPRPRARGRILSRSSPTRKRKLRGGVCVCCCAVCPGHRRAAHSPAPGGGPSGGHAGRDPQPRVRPKHGSLLLMLRLHSPSPGKARRVRSGGRALESAAVIEP